jgi:hypothetical protein
VERKNGEGRGRGVRTVWRRCGGGVVAEERSTGKEWAVSAHVLIVSRLCARRKENKGEESGGIKVRWAV